MAQTPDDASAQELRSTLADQRSVAVTIYNDDLALVKDQRAVTLPTGRSDLAFRDVSARIRPQTALLRSLDEAGDIHVIEQNFDFDLLTPAKLLEKYVGREVGIIRTHPTSGEETEEQATVLAAGGDGVVLRIGDRIETGVFDDGGQRLPGRLVYRDIPSNLRDRPTLVLRLDNAAAGARALELSYLTGGLSWQADYVGELGPGEDRLDLTGWVTLQNRSGTSYRNATLQLVAGDVNQVPEQQAFEDIADGMRVMAAAPAPMAEESLFEYHLYTLGFPTTIADNQSKQVSLLSAAGVAVAKELLIQGQSSSFRQSRGDIAEDLAVTARLVLTNDEASNLGLPLPEGVVRIYQRDSQGNAQFIGEDRIEHTPRNETLHLQLGQSFDVTAEKRQTAFKKLSGTGPWQYQFESAFEISVRNAKPEPQDVILQEQIPGDWTMLEESAPHDRPNAHIARWQLEVPAEGETTLSYRVRVRF
ncbi:DUF4139 domain-containing protein [Thiohalocapsa marina]|nr:DUF4139 domain-containing protein [Thiohalocapsa marina]